MLDVTSEPDSDCVNTFFNSFSDKKSNKIQRRFTEQQIKSLENIFQSESKLEPRKKLQLAKDLGLQPRQVAIWFQNKRARWKSKQLERDYNMLRASYDDLSSQFDILNRENQSLLLQLKKLQELMEEKGCGTNNSTKEKRSLSDEDSSIKDHTVVVEGDNWDDLEANPLLDNTSNQWWDFWS